MPNAAIVQIAPKSFFARAILGNAYVLLPLAALCFAGNHIVGRAIAGHIPPAGLTLFRWLLAAGILVPLAWPHLRRDWPVMRARWRILMFYGLLAGGLFTAMQYVGLIYTTALNTALLNSTIPVFIGLACYLLFGDRLSWRQIAGVLVSLSGVVAIIAKGDTRTLAGFAFNGGDLIIISNMAMWAVYSATLRLKPNIHPFSFTASIAVIGLCAVAPFHVWEILRGTPMQATLETFLTVFYVAIFPSVLAFLSWNRGVELIGAARAGIFTHLIPLFGAIMAMIFLGEQPGLYHLAGFALILAGVWLAARR